MPLKNISSEKYYLRCTMNVEKHISELLFEHNCVILPDFGGFVCNYCSAKIHLSKHQFHPPYKKISFNCNLKNNDGLLANQIAQVQEISYSDSLLLISEYVGNLKKNLNANKRIVFTNIGTIYLGEENNLLFEQDEKANYLPESFGLSTFISPAIKREPIERKIERAFKNKVITPSKEKPEAIPTKRRRVRYVLTASAILFVAFFVWVPFQSTFIKKIDYSNLNPFAAKEQPLNQPSEINTLDNNTLKENISDKLLAATSDTMRYLNIVIEGGFPIVVQLKEDATKVVKTKKKDSITKYRYQIVGGAFMISENAEKFYTQLINDGHEASIIDKKNLHFVSYGGFATKEDAIKALDKIRSIQSDAWLMTN
jgi:hypothetical protein